MLAAHSLEDREGPCSKPSETKPEPRGYKAWFFTINNPECGEAAFKERCLKAGAWRGRFQLELCPTTGTPHFQGAVAFKSQKRMSACKKQIHEGFWAKLEDWSMAYGGKEESRAPGHVPVEWGWPEERSLWCAINDVAGMRPWQKQLHDLVSVEPTGGDRTVHWYWEPTGNIGKTQFGVFMRDTLGEGKVLLLDKNAKDAAFQLRCVVKPLKAERMVWPWLCFFDFERSEELEVPYLLFNKIKSGWLSSGKYESTDIRFPPCHVVCFANFPPADSMCSADIWHIVEVTDST